MLVFELKVDLPKFVKGKNIFLFWMFVCNTNFYNILSFSHLFEIPFFIIEILFLLSTFFFIINILFLLSRFFLLSIFFIYRDSFYYQDFFYYQYSFFFKNPLLSLNFFLKSEKNKNLFYHRLRVKIWVAKERFEREMSFRLISFQQQLRVPFDDRFSGEKNKKKFTNFFFVNFFFVNFFFLYLFVR